MPPRIRFGEFGIDYDSRQLLRDGTEAHLSPKAFELLMLLLDSRPRAFSKRELHERLWPDTFVSDATLASVVSELRGALNDRGRKPRFIRTLHRFGYAFSGEASEIEPEAPASLTPWILFWGDRRLVLREGQNVLGRVPEATGIAIDDPTVSRRHARVLVQGDRVHVEDLGSKNGTWVRGERISGTAATIADGDKLQLGSVILMMRRVSDDTSTMTRVPLPD